MLGAARTSAYYAIAPFIAAILSLIIFREIPDITYFIALGFMIIGAWLSSQDKPLFKKKHKGIEKFSADCPKGKKETLVNVKNTQLTLADRK